MPIYIFRTRKKVWYWIPPVEFYGLFNGICVDQYINIGGTQNLSYPKTGRTKPAITTATPIPIHTLREIDKPTLEDILQKKFGKK
jgi:hypothetical protein